MAPVPSPGQRLGDGAAALPAAPAAGPVGAPPPSRRFLLALTALLLLHLTNPLAWGAAGSALWLPTAGLGLALVAWFGPRAALWFALDGLLVAAQAAWREDGSASRALVDALAGAVVLPAVWWLYQRGAGGKRGLGDPGSAMRFLFLVPGLGAGAWAAAHAGLAETLSAWSAELPALWLARALGVLVLAPVLLAGLTPWLARQGLTRPEADDGGRREPADVVGGGERLRWGDGLELFGLAAGAAALTGLAMRYGRGPAAGWPLWGAPLLLIVWTSLRQGLRGGLLVAAVSAGLPLLWLQGGLWRAEFVWQVQGNLLGQCAVALLVASSAGWVRGSEERYRQVTSHLPVVIYSARFRRPDRPPLCGRALEAEVTLVSAASEEVLGCRPGLLLGEHERWLERVHADDRVVVRAAVAQVGRQVRPVTCEYRLAGCEGVPRARWVRDTLAPRLDAEGRLVGWEGVLTDITPQRELADDLRRTTSMLHALIGNLPAGVFFVQGPIGTPILVNARARHLLGQREDLAAGLEHLSEVYRLHRPDGTPYPVEELPVFLALRKGLTAMRDDIVVHRSDGRRTPLVSWAAPVHLADRGNGEADAGAEAAVWVLEDLTALHQAEAARRDSEARLRTLVETMAEGLFLLDSSGRIVDCNSTAAALAGRPPERLRGLAPSDFDWHLLREDGTPLPVEDYPSAVVLRTGRPVRNLVLGLVSGSAGAGPRTVKPEEVRWMLVNAMPLGVGPDGKPAGVVVTDVDITSSVRAQRMLRESEERYRGLVESLPLMVIQADTALRVTYTNRATRDLTGYDRGEIAEPAVWAGLLHPDDLPRVMTLSQDALEGRSGQAEFRYRAKDGTEKVGLAFSEPVRRADGAVVGTTTLIADMTRQRQLEQELLRAQRLELVGRLSGGIAHDFNNLLTVILSLTEMVGASLPPDHGVQPDLGRIREAAEQAGNLAGQLLAFSKQRRVVAHRLPINQPVGRTLELLRATLPASIDLKAELSDDGLFIRGDETQVQQVLMNLCLNARDAMPAGGALHVRTARHGDAVLLSVSDQGSGIADEIKGRLFDPFFSTKERGTGLGLAVVRQIVEGHGGRVEVHSEPGLGARFDVWWPFCPEEDRTN